MPTRRRFLRAAVAGSVCPLAGCAAPTGRRPTPTAPAPTTSPTSPDERRGRPTSTPGREDPADRAMELVADLDRGDYEAAAAAFADGPGRLPPARLQRLWMGLTAQLGPYRGIAEAERGTDGGRDVVELTLALADGRQLARVALEDEEVVDLSFPASYARPEYADPDGFEERSLTLGDDCELSAAVCLPPGDGRVPGAVLVHGTGAHDRDETVGPNKPFRDLAWGLATQGVATVRYEKRTHACPVAPADQTVETVIVDDAVRAVARLAAHDRVGPVAVVGHSLGGTLAPRIAAEAGADGAAMLAAAARGLATLIREQVEYIADLDGAVTDSEAVVRGRVDRQIDRLEAGDFRDDQVVLGFPGAFWRSIREYDPVAAARAFDGPELFLQGERDYQVSPGRDFEQFRGALQDRSDAAFRRYADLDHLFMPGYGPSLPEEYLFPDNVDRQVVEDLAVWLGGLLAITQ